MLKRAVICSFLIFISACGLMPHKEFLAYEGPEKPLDEVASIAEGRRMWEFITKVDDVWIVDPIMGSIIGGRRFTKGIHVLPGRRTLYWRYYQVVGASAGYVDSESAEGKLEVDVVAGHSYVPVFIKSGDGSRVSVYLEDKGKNYNQECLKDTVLAGKETAVGC